MKQYLLDTHTAIWFFNGDPKLSENAKQIIRNRSNPVYLSIASAWEVAVKISIGKLDEIESVVNFLHDAETNDITILPITTSCLSTLEALPMHHRDPFDRLLVATAIVEQMTFITADENTPKYDVSHIW
ncbi:MAG: type II toxin-antitoxin system VapC family toxin [Bacteroidales bacterium]|jgi:PIN domain nuclease of toxin-antitoxin system|nr:type II toxin-antitoxin system VapC family toxin [Bacteroidales bacterium]